MQVTGCGKTQPNGGAVKRRVSALEANVNANNVDHPLKVALRDIGQTQADVLILAGYPTNAVRSVFVSPRDVSLWSDPIQTAEPTKALGLLLAAQMKMGA